MVEGTVGENIRLPYGLNMHRGRDVPADMQIRERLDFFRLGEIRPEDSAQKLSIGEQQRVALIRALLLDPEVLLLDEPVSALDGEARECVEQFLAEYNRERGKTVIMVSHERHELSGISVERYRISARGLEAIQP